MVGLASAGADTTNLMKQATEFGLTSGGTRVAALLCFIPQIHAMGLKDAKGLLTSEAFYWDLNDQTRAFSARYAPQLGGAMPCTIQVACYSGVMHYLKAVAALGVDAAKANGAAVVAKMKEIPTDDVVFGKGRLRADGRKIHDMHLFEVKAPAQSSRPWDTTSLSGQLPARKRSGRSPMASCPMIKA